MSDALYLSLWYPNLRLEGLPDKLAAVLGEFSKHGGERLVYAATVWPVNWHEAPVWQRVWGRAAAAGSAPAEGPVELGAQPRHAVQEAMELLHEDYAYEFQIGWGLWELANVGSEASVGGETGAATAARWERVNRLVRVTGYGPLFDEGAYEQDGHIRIDFGSDAPFLEEGSDLDSEAARRLAENVRQLVDLTNAVEKASGATARLLWSELGESLAQKLAQRLAALPGGQGN